jgi:hypothetical protein
MAGIENLHFLRESQKKGAELKAIIAEQMAE